MGPGSAYSCSQRRQVIADQINSKRTVGPLLAVLDPGPGEIFQLAMARKDLGPTSM